MLTVLTVSIVLFRKAGNNRLHLPLVDCPKNISESTVDKMEQSYFATGFM